ncbi:hypothetical protein BCR32DRAFT_327834 [Anaeromyces robustus]|uniref:Uncharacterized protein n=1 Tax=Anaeromyces robustus TaxID=1754192 RepID=A0A1Y1X345_9FUNG|nr:hypothetical protein BCR32DRAFT_327834 [Anaeromyces robustus]|eukprot:ORX80112.1 hypothetical protein BCR32DRAFT_327834 [Anaeromyces robustus]
MEDYLYEKKKKFEMIKRKNSLRKSKQQLHQEEDNINININDLKLQVHQCEKNILRNYEFKSKSKDLVPIKHKVMLKKRQSTEKNLMLNTTVLDDNYCTNTIYLQEDEFNINENNNNYNNNIMNTEEFDGSNNNNSNNNNNIYSGNLDIEDIIFSKRDSSLTFHAQSYNSSLLEIVSVQQDTPSIQNNTNSRVNSSVNMNMNTNTNMNMINSNSNITLNSSQGKLQKKKSMSSFIQKPTNVLKKVKSFIQNSPPDNVNIMDNNNNNNSENNFITNSTKEFVSKSPKKSFSFRSRNSKSIESLNNNSNNNNNNNNEYQHQRKSSTSTTTSNSKKIDHTHRSSFSKTVMKKFSSLTKLTKTGSTKNINNNINNNNINSNINSNNNNIKNSSIINKNTNIHDSDITLNNDDKKASSIDELSGKFVEEKDLTGLHSDSGEIQTELNKKNFERLCSILYYVEPNQLINYFEQAKGDENIAISLYVDIAI